jgi:hypothetical protein
MLDAEMLLRTGLPISVEAWCFILSMLSVCYRPAAGQRTFNTWLVSQAIYWLSLLKRHHFWAEEERSRLMNAEGAGEVSGRGIRCCPLGAYHKQATLTKCKIRPE